MSSTKSMTTITTTLTILFAVYLVVQVGKYIYDSRSESVTDPLVEDPTPPAATPFGRPGSQLIWRTAGRSRMRRRSPLMKARGRRSSTIAPVMKSPWTKWKGFLSEDAYPWGTQPAGLSVRFCPFREGTPIRGRLERAVARQLPRSNGPSGFPKASA